jgi:hypothetical protein
MTLELVPLCTVDVTLREPIMVGEGPAGTRVIGEVASATFRGERLSGSMLGQAAADWLVVNGSVGIVDVRIALRTDDGATIFAQYRGRMDLSAGAQVVYVAPTFETGDERYSWLNTVQAVGRGRLDGQHLVYEWYEVR